MKRGLGLSTQSAVGLVFVYKTDPDGNGTVLFVNSAIENIYGLKPEDVEKNIVPIMKRVHQDDSPLFAAALRESASSLFPFIVEYRVNHPEKGTIWVETCAVPAPEKDGSVLWHGLTIEMTERARKASLLAEYERNLHSLANNVSDNIARYAPDARILYFSSVLERSLGIVSSEPYLDKTPMDCFPSERVADYQQEILAVARTGESRELELSIPRPDGTIRYHRICLVPERDRQNNIISVLAIGTDVTEHRRMEEELKSREREFRVLAQAIPGILLHLDRDCRVVYANPAFEAFTGFPRDDVLGKVPSQIPGILDADCLEQRVRNAIEKRMKDEFKHYIQKPDGSGIWGHICIVPEFDKASRILYIQVLIWDVTELAKVHTKTEKREQLLNTIANNALEGFCVLDTDHRFIRVNAAYCSMTGFDPDELSRMTVLEMDVGMTEIERERIMRVYRETGRARFETKHKHKGGGHIDVEICVDNASDLTIFFCRNITDQKKKQEHLKFLDFALNHTREAVFLIDEDARFLYVNDEACSSLGYERDCFLRMTMADIVPDWSISRWRENWQELSKKGSVILSGRHKARNGRIFPIEVSASYFRYGDRWLNLSFVHDVDHKSREVEIKRLVELCLSTTQELSELIKDIDAPAPKEKTLSDYGFSARQIEIARQVVGGAPSKEIAVNIGLTEAAVKKNLVVMYRRLQVKGRMEFGKRITEESLRLE